MRVSLARNWSLFRFFSISIASLTIGLTGCGGGKGSSILPSGSGAATQSTRQQQAISASLDTVAINVGGPAVGGFAADVFGGGGQTGSVNDTIDVSGPNVGPAAIYQTQRFGQMAYTIPGLVPGTNYTVRLHFAETWFGLSGRPGAGARRFNISVSGAPALNNFDIYAAAGAADKAVVHDFSATASPAGQIAIWLQNGAANLPTLSGIEIFIPAGVSINVGGPTVGSFLADFGGIGGNVSSSTTPTDVSAPNAAPAAVYTTQRWGPMTYTIPGFTPGASYVVRLHFSEQYWGAGQSPGGTGSRKFNVAFNGIAALTNFDVFATAGAANKAVVVDRPATADSNGTFTIAFTKGASDNPMVSAIQIFSTAAGPGPSPTPLPSASPGIVTLQALNVGGGGAGRFAADTVPNGGSNGTISATGAAIDVSAPNAAPQFVYQSQRYGPVQWVLTGLTPNALYTVRLHFAELYFGTGGRAGTGQRRFNVAINGAPQLTNFDVYATAGAANTAVIRDFPVSAATNGNITLTLTNGAADNAMLNGIEILGTGPAPPIVVGSEPSKMADSFVNAIGVNTHLSNFNTYYGQNFNGVLTLLQNAGIRHVRDGVPAGNALLCAQEATFAPAGIFMNVIVNGDGRDLSASMACLKGTAESIEALNEADLNYGPNWASDLRADTNVIVSLFPGFPLVAPSVTTVEAEITLGSMSSIVNYGNAHAYFAGRNPGTYGWGAQFPYGVYGSLAYNLGVAAIVSGSKPIYITETGYSDDLSDQYAVPSITKARYTLRAFLEAFNAGVPRVYEYEFLDEGPTPFSHYGIVDASGHPKLVYNALASMIGYLKDPGGAFSPNSLKCTIGAASNIHHTLLQRRNGTYELVLWNELPEWDPVANKVISTSSQVAELTFATPPSSIKQTTFSDAGSLTTASLPSSQLVSVSVSAWPTILDINP